MAHKLREPAAPFHTHEVANQVPPLEGRNLFEDNVPLVEALEREGAGWALGRAREAGAAWGADPIRWGFEANENPPELKAFDRYGHRIDEVEFHRAWHDLMALPCDTSCTACRGPPTGRPRSAGTAANVIVIGQAKPPSACAAVR